MIFVILTTVDTQTYLPNKYRNIVQLLMDVVLSAVDFIYIYIYNACPPFHSNFLPSSKEFSFYIHIQILGCFLRTFMHTASTNMYEFYGISYLCKVFNAKFIFIHIVMSHCQQGFSWPSLATHLYRLLFRGGRQGYILYRHRAAVYSF